MVKLQISLPEATKRWLDAYAQAGRYRDASDLVRQLIEREQEREDRIAAMQLRVDEARSGGFSIESMADLRERALRQAGKQG